jgi:cytochrome c5
MGNAVKQHLQFSGIYATIFKLHKCANGANAVKIFHTSCKLRHGAGASGLPPQ